MKSNSLNRRTLGMSALGVLAAGLALAVPGAALADTTPATPSGHALHGTVTSVSPLTVAVPHGQDAPTPVIVTLDNNARISVPGAHASTHGRQPRLGAASLSSIHQGDEVVAQGQYSADGKTFKARRLHLVPA